jgi:hypothetical protein
VENREYSSFEHLALSVCSNRGKGWRFVMIDAQTVYVDDSGTDTKSKIITAAFCVSTIEKWLQFERQWKKISINAGFKHFHMTEFAACRREKPCNQCIRGKTTLEHHPWRRWTAKKRKNVLRQLAETVVEFVEYGVGLAYTKQDFDDHIKNSPARLHSDVTIPEQYFTYAVQRCGGELARWRAQRASVNPPLKFVFDLTPKEGRDEIANVFFGAANDDVPHCYEGIEERFIPQSVSYENRRDVVQLLSADMLAWVTATIRAREMFGPGETLEMFQVAHIFVGTNHIRMGNTPKESFAQWERDILNGAKSN